MIRDMGRRKRVTPKAKEDRAPRSQKKQGKAFFLKASAGERLCRCLEDFEPLASSRSARHISVVLSHCNVFTA